MKRNPLTRFAKITKHMTIKIGSWIYQHVFSRSANFCDNLLGFLKDINDWVVLSWMSKVALLPLSGYLSLENFVSGLPIFSLQDPRSCNVSDLLNKKVTSNIQKISWIWLVWKSIYWWLNELRFGLNAAVYPTMKLIPTVTAWAHAWFLQGWTNNHKHLKHFKH